MRYCDSCYAEFGQSPRNEMSALGVWLWTVVVVAVRQTGLKFGSRFLSLSKRASCHMGEEIRRKTKATCQFGTRPLILAVGCWPLMGGEPDRLVKSVRHGVAKSG